MRELAAHFGLRALLEACQREAEPRIAVLVHNEAMGPAVEQAHRAMVEISTALVRLTECAREAQSGRRT